MSKLYNNIWYNYHLSPFLHIFAASPGCLEAFDPLDQPMSGHHGTATMVQLLHAALCRPFVAVGWSFSKTLPDTQKEATHGVKPCKYLVARTALSSLLDMNILHWKQGMLDAFKPWPCGTIPPQAPKESALLPRKPGLRNSKMENSSPKWFSMGVPAHPRLLGCFGPLSAVNGSWKMITTGILVHYRTLFSSVSLQLYLYL